jgi:hypothetical protein
MKTTKPLNDRQKRVSEAGVGTRGCCAPVWCVSLAEAERGIALVRTNRGAPILSAHVGPQRAIGLPEVRSTQSIAGGLSVACETLRKVMNRSGAKWHQPAAHVVRRHRCSRGRRGSSRSLRSAKDVRRGIAHASNDQRELPAEGRCFERPHTLAATCRRLFLNEAIPKHHPRPGFRPESSLTTGVRHGDHPVGQTAAEVVGILLGGGSVGEPDLLLQLADTLSPLRTLVGGSN